MSEYLVRWTFAANNPFRSNQREVVLYQFHKDKKSAVDHYVSLLNHSRPVDGMTTEIFVLEQLIPGQPEPEDVVEEIEEDDEETIETRNARIISMYENGYSRREISDSTGLSYQTIYGITRPRSQN